MQSNAARLGVLAAVVAAAAVLFIVLGSDDADDSNTETTTTGTTTQTDTGTVPVEQGVTPIEVRNGKPVGGVQEIEVSKGERVRIEIQLDRPEEEIHVHSYEITKPAQKSPVQISFTADKEGIFEIEVHREDGSEAQIAELRVNP